MPQPCRDEDSMDLGWCHMYTQHTQYGTEQHALASRLVYSVCAHMWWLVIRASLPAYKKKINLLLLNCTQLVNRKQCLLTNCTCERVELVAIHNSAWIPTKIPKAYQDKGKYGLNLDTFDCSPGFTKIALFKDTGDNRTPLPLDCITPLWLYTVWLKSRDGNWCDDREEHGGGCRHWQLSDVHSKENPDFSDKSKGLCLYHNAGTRFPGREVKACPSAAWSVL